MVLWLIMRRRVPLLGRLFEQVLGLMGIEVPRQIDIPSSTRFVHRGHGTVLSPNTRVGENVTFYHRVTIARSNSWVRDPVTETSGVEIGNWAVLCPGSVVLFGAEAITVGEGTVVGANSVLTRSTGAWEIWAGSPARKVGERVDRPDTRHRSNA